MRRESFHGKNVVITGGSAGIGLCVARELARRGANLAIIARDRERLEAARGELAGYGIKAFAYPCDVTDAENLGRCIADARAHLGSIDGIIANSGYCHPGYFHELTPDDLYRQVNVNLMGSLYAIRHAVPHLIESGRGFIAITSSPAGNAGIFGFSAYGATKAALNNLAHVLRSEYRRYNIRVHLLLPPDTRTPGYAHEVPLYPKETKAVLAGGRLFEPEIVAKKFVEGVAKNKKQVTIGLETHLMLFLVRHMPRVWDFYVRRKTT